MKKKCLGLAGQKKLTHFFSGISSKESADSKQATTVDKSQDSHLSNNEIGNSSPKKARHPLNEVSEKCLPPSQSSPNKKRQTLIHNFSPQKEEKSCQNGISSINLNTKRTTTKIVLNGKKAQKKTSPVKKTQQSPEKLSQAKLCFSPTKTLGKDACTVSNNIIECKDEGDNSFLNQENVSIELSVSKKRKFVDSPSEKKINGFAEIESAASSSSQHQQDNVENLLNDINITEWGDETDFVNLNEDVIVISPKKLQIKKCKLSKDVIPQQAKCSLDFDKPAHTNKKTNNLGQKLATYFSSGVTIEDEKCLKFDKLKRYEVIKVDKVNHNFHLTLRSLTERIEGVCTVRSPWNDCDISVKDIISVKGVKRDEGWVVDWDGGLLVINPDRLISGTTIVGSVYCMRKSVLSHIFKESGGTKDCMVIGSIVHGLFQEVLKQKIRTLEKIEEEYQRLIKSKDFLLQLFLNNLNYEETVSKVHPFVNNIHKFMQHYVFGEIDPANSSTWHGEIVETEDIEENIWSPVLGVKGKVDATVQVKINKKTKVVPLELKTGKVSFSIEHRGQVILYCMLLQQLGRNVDAGLLLYLNSGFEMKEIKCEERETRDLTLLRNGLCHWLQKSSHVDKCESIKPPTLPPPINRRSCSSCSYLVPCSAALKVDGLDKLSKDHYLKDFGTDATKHLSNEHINFVFHWLGLLNLEKNSSSSNVKDIWSVNSDIREKSGKCLAQMRIDNWVKEVDNGFKTTFSKMNGSLLETDFTVGQLIIVSTEDHLALALGVIQSISPISLTVMLDKQLKTFKDICLDAYEGDSLSTILTSSLSCLLDNSSRASILRELIIDLKIPTFSSKLSSKIKKIGEDIFGRLNREQVRAVLQAIASDNYILIKGMPGTGKTRTMAALIELLTRLKKRVLVTSYTHSAIDNILINLIGKAKMIRLGPEHRVHEKLKDVSEHHFIRTMKDSTPAAIEEIFSTKEVVGVTCFGCKHPWIERQVFDVCLVDEATQVSLPGILKPISLAQKFILVGDPKQLPPLILNNDAKKLGLGISLFERLDRPAVTSPLTLQYRMNGVITSLANDLTYEGMLKCANETVEQSSLSPQKSIDESIPVWLKKCLSGVISESVIILNIKNNTEGEVGENLAEAAAVVRIIDALMKGGNNEESIGVITTYSRQVSLLKSKITQNVEVNTVDQYQGRDKDVIIYSTARTSASAERNDILSDWNRLTVAVTRAKTKLIILGNLDVLRCYNNFNKLISSVSCENIIEMPADFTS